MTSTTDQTVVELLEAQHVQIKRLFVGVANAQGRQKQDLFEDLVRLMAVHECAEAQVVHPTARRNIDGGEEIVAARLAEESAAKQALAQMYDLGVDHPDFDNRLTALAEDVIRHSAAEESTEFARLRSILDRDELVRMAGVLRAAESVAPTRSHPAAGAPAPANMIMGSPIAVFDRVSDAARDWSRS